MQGLEMSMHSLAQCRRSHVTSSLLWFCRMAPWAAMRHKALQEGFAV